MGSPTRVVRRALAVRFWEKVNKDGPVPAHRPELGRCWIWTGYRTKAPPRRKSGGGYGRLYADGAVRAAHVVAFFLAHGRWPDPWGLHHCDNPSCVKAWADEDGPAHVYEGTPADNVRDMVERGRLVSPVADALAAQTACYKGHPLEGRNLILHRDGTRECRTCENARQRRYQAAREGRPAPEGPPRPRCKLTETQVAEIRALSLGRGDLSRVAASYGVSPSAVSMIRAGKRWSGGTKHRSGPTKLKDHCKRGHPLTGDNVYVRGSARHCRTCRRDLMRRRRKGD